MTIDLTAIYRKHKGRWVALNENYSKVVASGNSAPQVYKIAKKKGYRIPKLLKVPSNLTAYIG